jgi:hypothetical protein
VPGESPPARPHELGLTLRPQLEGSPWYAIVPGTKSRLRGLVLFDGEEDRRLLARADHEEIADQLQNIGMRWL